MSAKYTLASSSSTYDRLQNVDSCLIQLSDGTDAFLYFDPSSSSYILAYSSDHSTVNTIATLDTGTGGASFSPGGEPLCFALVRDASDNLFVVGRHYSPSGYLQVQAFKKGAGYSWAAQAALSGNVGASTPLFGFAAAWCNTGGGTNSAGHLMVLVAPGGGTSVNLYAICDAGAALAGSGTIVTAFGQGGFLGSGGNSSASNIDMASDGFGVPSGIAAVPNGNSALTVGSWSVTSAGVLGTNAAISATVTTAGQSSNTKVRVLRVSSNLFAVVAPASGSSDLAAMRFSATAALDASPTPTGQTVALGSPGNYLEWDAFVDPATPNRLWIIAQKAQSGGVAQVVRLGCTVSSSVAWDGAVTNDDSLTATGFLSGQGNLRVVTQPGAVVSWQTVLKTSSSPVTYALVGDNTPFASAPAAPSAQSPSNGAYIDATSGVSFTLLYNSTDGKNQNAYALRLKTAGGSYSYWNAATSAWQSTIVWNAVSTLPGAAFTVGPITAGLSNGHSFNWSAASQEAGANLQGPFAGDFTFNAQAAPSLTVSGPSGTITSATPTVSWTPSPAAGASITAWQVKVFSAAQYGAGGFAPSTSAATWDSGVVAGNQQSVQVGTALTNGTTYRFYVQVTESGGELSSWVYQAGTISFTPPATPTVAAAAGVDPNGIPAIIITATDTETSLSGATTLTVTRSDGVVVRGCPVAVSTAGQAFSLYDLEAVPGQAYTYAAAVTSTPSPGQSVQSGASTSVPVTLAVSDWWLINPVTPGLSAQVEVISDTPVMYERASAHYGVGADRPVVFADVVGGIDGQLQIETQDAAGYAQIIAIIQAQSVVWLASPISGSGSVAGRYVRLGIPPGQGSSGGGGNTAHSGQLKQSPATKPVRVSTFTYVQMVRP